MWPLSSLRDMYTSWRQTGPENSEQTGGPDRPHHNNVTFDTMTDDLGRTPRPAPPSYREVLNQMATPPRQVHFDTTSPQYAGTGDAESTLLQQLPPSVTRISGVSQTGQMGPSALGRASPSAPGQRGTSRHHLQSPVENVPVSQNRTGNIPPLPTTPATPHDSSQRQTGIHHTNVSTLNPG